MSLEEEEKQESSRWIWIRPQHGSARGEETSYVQALPTRLATDLRASGSVAIRLN
jgi:hypothetical protein